MADKNLDCPHDKRKDCTVCGHPGMSKTRKHNCSYSKNKIRTRGNIMSCTLRNYPNKNIKP